METQIAVAVTQPVLRHLAAEAKMTDSTLHASVFNAAYLATVVLATVGWLWLIVYFVEWTIGI